MSKPYSVITALKTLLDNNAGVAAVVKQTFIGTRQIDSVVLYPSLMIEVSSDDERDGVYPIQENHLLLQVIGIVRTNDIDTLLSDTMDLANIVKKAIDTDRTIGATASHTTIGETTYSTDLWPVRTFSMNIDIWYQQTAGTRT